MKSLLLLLLLPLLLLSTLPLLSSSTPLDDYVWKADPAYQWVDLKQKLSGVSLDGKVRWEGHLLNVTSQTWLTPADSTRSLWWHTLCVIIPSNVEFTRNASLYVTGGSNDNPSNLPTATDEDILVAAALAVGSKSITGAFFQVPNEHITFSSDPIQKSRSEDAIIAFTWDHFLSHPDEPEWLVRLPMVKSVLRGMDAMTEYVSTVHSDLGCSLDYYNIAGASKRGWTTWLMGAVDPDRVMTISPIVLDAVNFIQFSHKQFKSYGGWSFALEDYYDMNITERFDDPNMLQLSKIEDPYFYFDRLTMPKLIVNAVGDEFQQPDDTSLWWADLPEPKHFLMVPNAEHSMATGILEVVPAIGSWLHAHFTETSIPKVTWDIAREGEGDISVAVALSGGYKIASVRKMYGETCNGERRDFRFLTNDSPCTCGVEVSGQCFNAKSFWKGEDIAAEEDDGANSKYLATYDAPADGKWAAFFVEVRLVKEDVEEAEEMEGSIVGRRDRDPFIPRSKPGELVFTSEVSIVPNIFPFDDCHMETCKGTLV